MTSTQASVDVLDQLADIAPDSPLAAARTTRDAATSHIQGSYRALFTAGDGIDFPLPERFEVARQVALWHGDSRLADHYAALQAAVAPPAGGARLEAALSHAQLLSHHPAGATPGHLAGLRRVGWSLDAIVTLSQLIAFVSFQSRLLRGYRLINHQPVANPSDQAAPAGRWRTGGRTHQERSAPQAFTQRELGWEPWIAAKKLTEFSPQQQTTLVNNGHADSDYFRLLGRNLAVLEQRTLTDKGIFYTSGGLTRKERELAAAVASKVNGCIYCASVHARKASQLSKRPDDIQRLLDIPSGSVLSTGQSPRWQAIIDFAAALSASPAVAGVGQLTRLRELGLSDLELLDLVQATAFFAWANRLMLTLGEPFDDEARP
ncbi:alkylhydroperoxidase domain protein [Acerihabitans arboris]|uniref:Alkylhydroperoxidase domain protein n=1 Tax=Acerihabitans arboris TaxID=2691583 RepID=A0A845SMA4_9GAMM|nr:alkylhydroperoxidase domain protein [Acerihabitans arboris]NDL64084.1 alkylhydroperoxidase domain protein [Acerihabitans arboris]